MENKDTLNGETISENYKKILTEEVKEKIMSQTVRDMPENPAALGYSTEQIRRFFWVGIQELLNIFAQYEDISLEFYRNQYKKLGYTESSPTPSTPGEIGQILIDGQANMYQYKGYDEEKGEHLWCNVFEKSLGDAIENAVESANNYTDNKFNGANKAVSFNNYNDMISALYNSEPADYTLGQNIYIKTLNVPDLWISIETIWKSDCTYVSDEDFINELKEKGTVQIGYFGVSALETQKVDLTDYKTKDFQINGTSAVENGVVNLIVDEKNATKNSIVRRNDAGKIVSAKTVAEDGDSILTTKSYVDTMGTNKVDKLQDSGDSVERAYVNINGEDKGYSIGGNAFYPVKNTLVKYFDYNNTAVGASMADGASAVLVTPVPIRPYHVANKKYVDDSRFYKHTYYLMQPLTDDEGNFTEWGEALPHYVLTFISKSNTPLTNIKAILEQTESGYYFDSLSNINPILCGYNLSGMEYGVYMFMQGAAGSATIIQFNPETEEDENVSGCELANYIIV